MRRSTSRLLTPLAASLVALTLTATVAACDAHDGGRDQPSTASVASTPVIPQTPVGHQLRWVLDHLASGGPPLTVDEIKRHISGELLRDVLPAETHGLLVEETANRPSSSRLARCSHDIDSLSAAIRSRWTPSHSAPK